MEPPRAVRSAAYQQDATETAPDYMDATAPGNR